MVVVATTFVSEAMSKRVQGLTSKSPPCRKERDKDGAPSGLSVSFG